MKILYNNKEKKFINQKMKYYQLKIKKSKDKKKDKKHLIFKTQKSLNNKINKLAN